MTTTGSTALVLRITELKAENAALKEQYSKAEDANYNLQGKLLVAQNRIKILREALESVAGSVSFGSNEGFIADNALSTPDNTAELDALIKDAMRYRWMRDVADFPAICAPDGDEDDWDWVPMRNKEQINAAIDAAMQSDTPPKE